MEPSDDRAAGEDGDRTAVVRRVLSEDWSVLRSVRLAALADAPDAFGSTLAEEERYSEAEWRAWLHPAAVFVALTDGRPVGMAAGIVGDHPEERKLVAAWVHPSHRRYGVGAALLSAVEAWAVEDGAATLVLWVTRGNTAAGALYRRHGFAPTGRVKPLPSNPTLIEEQLALRLPSAQPCAMSTNRE
jgi:GNAT superfamily N-acetyltransferase